MHSTGDITIFPTKVEKHIFVVTNEETLCTFDSVKRVQIGVFFVLFKFQSRVGVIHFTISFTIYKPAAHSTFEFPPFLYETPPLSLVAIGAILPVIR